MEVISILTECGLRPDGLTGERDRALPSGGISSRGNAGDRVHFRETDTISHGSRAWWREQSGKLQGQVRT